MSNYRLITIGARMAPLSLVLDEAHQQQVQAEFQLAYGAPALFEAAKSALKGLEALKDCKPVDLDLIRRDLRAALIAAGEEF